MQILCRFLRVRKSPQNTANHGILGGKKCKRECFSSATARVKTTVMYNALWGSVGQISALCELLLCQNTTVGLRMTKEKIVSVKVACSRVVTLKTIANSYR